MSLFSQRLRREIKVWPNLKLHNVFRALEPLSDMVGSCHDVSLGERNRHRDVLPEGSPYLSPGV
jgi:hypothetical protein